MYSKSQDSLKRASECTRVLSWGMPRRRPLTRDESDAILRRAEEMYFIIQRASDSSGPVLDPVYAGDRRWRRRKSIFDRMYGGRLGNEAAAEIKRHLAAIIVLAREHQPRKPVPVKLTPALCAARRRLLAALAKKVKTGKSERQVVRGRGAAVGWSDGTLRNRLMDYMQGKKVRGT